MTRRRCGKSRDNLKIGMVYPFLCILFCPEKRKFSYRAWNKRKSAQAPLPILFSDGGDYFDDQGSLCAAANGWCYATG